MKTTIAMKGKRILSLLLAFVIAAGISLAALPENVMAGGDIPVKLIKTDVNSKAMTTVPPEEGVSLQTEDDVKAYLQQALAQQYEGYQIGSIAYIDNYFEIYYVPTGAASSSSGSSSAASSEAPSVDTAAAAPAELSIHDQNEQAALQEQAMEREMRAAGVSAAVTPEVVVATVAPNGNFTALRNFFRQAAATMPESAFPVYVRASNGDRDSIWSLYPAAVSGDINAILALYAAASNGSPFAIFELQLLGYTL